MTRTPGAARLQPRDQKVPEYENRILEFLHDEGPHETHDIVKFVDMSPAYVAYILNGMKESGLIVRIRIGRPARAHWILAEDA